MTCSRRCLCYLPALKHGSKHSTKFHLTKFKNVEMDWATQCFWWLSAVPHRTLNSMLFSASRTLWAAACAKAWTDCTGFSNSRVHQTCMSRTLCSVVVFFFFKGICYISCDQNKNLYLEMSHNLHWFLVIFSNSGCYK